jgi:hypothetical protein
MHDPDRIRLPETRCARVRAIVLLAGVCLAVAVPPVAQAAITKTPNAGSSPPGPTVEGTDSTLEAAAAKAGDTGRTVAMSLIGLALAVAAIVLAFKRDFKEAAGVFAVGIVAVLLATPTGVSLLQDTVSSLFGSH